MIHGTLTLMMTMVITIILWLLLLQKCLLKVKEESTFHFPIPFVGQTNNSSSQCNRDLFLV